MGAPKTGKTTLLETFPFGNVYVLDSDAGMASLLGRPNIYFDTFLDADPKKPTGFMEMNKKVDELVKNAIETGKVWLPNEQGERVEFGLVTLDSTSTLLELIMNQVLFTKGRPGGTPTSSDWKDNDWTAQMVSFGHFINKIRGLPCSFAMICHEHLDKNETTDVDKKIYPDITGRTATKIGLKFDLIFRTVTKLIKDAKGTRVEYNLLTQNDGIAYAGNRYRDALNMYEAPDLGAIFDKIEVYRQRVIKEKGGEG